jgi:hypothetical protein
MTGAAFSRIAQSGVFFFAGLLDVVEDYGEIADEVRNELFEALDLDVLKNWFEPIAHVRSFDVEVQAAIRFAGNLDLEKNFEAYIVVRHDLRASDLKGPLSTRPVGAAR